jgi:DNA-binding response OmpR family regulator
MARFLVVEDFPPLTAVIAAFVKREGHEVVQCHTVQSALELTDTFDHAVLDLDLPDGSGVELAEQLIDRNSVGSVVFFTASRDREALARAASMGLVVDKAAGCDRLAVAVGQLTHPGTYRLAAVAGSPTGAVIGGANRSGTRRKVDQKR